MKSILLLGLMLGSLTISAQIKRVSVTTKDWQQDPHAVRTEKATWYIQDEVGLLRKKTLLNIGVSFSTGVFYGIHETVVHKPFRIPDNWNRQWWDSRESWKNKYRNGDPNQGQAFPGSMGLLVWPTDAKHLFGGLYRVGMFGSGVTISIGEKRPVRYYLAQAVVSGLSFSAGFALVNNTNLIFK
jgi:hypothetical protein